MQGLGYTGQEAYDKAHDIGCNCHGASITANDAATRVEELT